MSYTCNRCYAHEESDRCGEIILTTVDGELFKGKKLCQKCMKKIIRYIGIDPNEDMPDIGKIRALRKAGWSYEKIAREMRMEEDAIRNALREAGRRERLQGGNEDGNVK